MLFIGAWPVLPFGEPEGLGQAAKHDLALFFNSIGCISLCRPLGKMEAAVEAIVNELGQSLTKIVNCTPKKMMTKEEYLKLAEKKWEELHGLRKETNFYDYEKEFDRIWVELGKEVLERSISKPGKDRRKKKG